MDSKEKKKKQEEVFGFNPSARTPVILDLKDLDYIEKVMREAGMKMAEEEDKQLLITLMGLIRKKLREDPAFAPKLRELLELDKYFLDLVKRPNYPKKKIRKVRVGTDYVEYEIRC